MSCGRFGGRFGGTRCTVRQAGYKAYMHAYCLVGHICQWTVRTVCFCWMLSTERRAQQQSMRQLAASLEALQTELHTFLSAHTQRLLALQESFLPANSRPIATQRPVSTATNRDSGHFDLLSSVKSIPPEPPLASASIDVHVSNLKDFLNSQIRSIGMLRDTLPQPDGKSPSKPVTAPEPESAKKFEALGSQFNMIVVISTFTASLIISYLSLVKSIVNDNHAVAFDIGMFLSYFAMNIHFGNIIVAGRGSALTSQLPVDDAPGYDLKYFHHYLELCEQLQFFATIVFLAAVTQLTFFVFHDITLPLILLGVSAFSSLVVFWIAYWKVSITLRNLKFIIRRVRGLRIWSMSYLHRRSASS
ncbi:hypothetical protein D9615_004918 [Tricholomella constricta]|uniref:Uncharacterized protein n=1 Tax=Tricholomella constricta TaxID=117010 RepID=A0A8H5HH54_9AGAR|nr:hypothetical protein D9615_004918 [Tricholomella constricta]